MVSKTASVKEFNVMTPLVEMERIMRRTIIQIQGDLLSSASAAFPEPDV
jgi:hypothetical protein